MNYSPSYDLAPTPVPHTSPTPHRRQQCPKLWTPFSRKQAENARFVWLKTSVLGSFSENRVYKFGHRETEKERKLSFRISSTILIVGISKCLKRDKFLNLCVRSIKYGSEFMLIFFITLFLVFLCCIIKINEDPQQLNSIAVYMRSSFYNFKKGRWQSILFYIHGQEWN